MTSPARGRRRTAAGDADPISSPGPKTVEHRRLEPVPVAERHNLPALRARLIGREDDCARVRDLVRHAPGRLVTLTGAGGCGKTQLGVAVAAGCWTPFPTPCGWWSSQGSRVPHSCRMRWQPCSVATNALAKRCWIRWLDISKLRDMLLVLDNCEHVIDACSELADRLLDACPRLRLLATSRERLRIAAETPGACLPCAAPFNARAPPTLICCRIRPCNCSWSARGQSSPSSS